MDWRCKGTERKKIKGTEQSRVQRGGEAGNLPPLCNQLFFWKPCFPPPLAFLLIFIVDQPGREKVSREQASEGSKGRSRTVPVHSFDRIRTRGLRHARTPAWAVALPGRPRSQRAPGAGVPRARERAPVPSATLTRACRGIDLLRVPGGGYAIWTCDGQRGT